MISPKIGLAYEDGSSQLAGLAGQLGYPSPIEQVATRLVKILSQPDHAIFVADVGRQIAR